VEKTGSTMEEIIMEYDISKIFQKSVGKIKRSIEIW